PPLPPLFPYTTLFRSGGRAAAVEHVDHLLVQLALRREALAGRDLAHVAIIGGARRVVVEIDPSPAAARPGLELDGVQVLHVEGADRKSTRLNSSHVAI